jgi:AcrR family transcriptional regulator
MRYSEEQVGETRRRMIEAAARLFRRHGYAGVGVDALAGEAEVTSGAVYGQFGSKAGLFREVVAAGAADLTQDVRAYQAECGDSWIAAMAADYLAKGARRDVEGSCGLSSLAPEIVRADPGVRRDFQKALREAADAMAAAAPLAGREDARAEAFAVLALLAGGVTLARAVPDAKLADDIAAAVEAAVARIARAD